uniref:Uncharacterized protein n=1 Tax=Anguilla anguilla TaxID=7936 RepID=A0A0E9XXF3_ANGAN
MKFLANRDFGFKHFCSPLAFKVAMISRCWQDKLGDNTSTFSISLGLMKFMPVSMH